MKRAIVFQLAFGGAIVLGLGAAALCRAPEVRTAASPEPLPPAPLPAPAPDPAPPVVVVPAPVSSAATAVAAPARPPPADESSLMSELRSIRTSDPARAVQLAEEGNRRFPDSPDAPERASILVHAFAAQGNHSEARRSAEEMVNHYPDSDWVREVELFTGAHRHRSIRINGEGGVEYY